MRSWCIKCGGALSLPDQSCWCQPYQLRIVDQSEWRTVYSKKDVKPLVTDLAETYYSDNQCNPSDFEIKVDVKYPDGSNKFFMVTAEPDVIFHVAASK